MVHITKISAGGKPKSDDKPKPKDEPKTDSRQAVVDHLREERQRQAEAAEYARTHADEIAAAKKASEKAAAKTEKARIKAEKKAEKAARKAEKQANKKPLPPFLAAITAPFRAIGRYFRDSWKEIRQVRWPSRKATWKLVLAVFAYTAIFMAFIMLLDAFLTFIFNNLLG